MVSIHTIALLYGVRNGRTRPEAAQGLRRDLHDTERVARGRERRRHAAFNEHRAREAAEVLPGSALRADLGGDAADAVCCGADQTGPGRTRLARRRIASPRDVRPDPIGSRVLPVSDRHQPGNTAPNTPQPPEANHTHDPTRNHANLIRYSTDARIKKCRSGDQI